MFRRWTLLLVAIILAPCALAAWYVQPQGINYAFLVGCSNYQKAEFHMLPFTGNDVLGFQDALKTTNFDDDHMVVLYDKAADPTRFLPNKANILHELGLLLARTKKNDTLVVALSGHGVQFKGDPVSYFVPLDGRVADKTSLIPLDGKNGLYERINKCNATKKLLIVNACRNDPAVNVDFATTKVELVDEDRKEEVPEGIAAIYSCQAGQKSYFDKDRKLAIFFDHVIRAWKGEYTKDGKVTLEKFFNQVEDKTATDASKLYSRSQVPVVMRGYNGNWEIAAAKPVDTASEKPAKKKTDLNPRSKTAATLPGHRQQVYSLAFSVDGKTLASASGDKTVKLWDVALGKERATFEGLTMAVDSVAFSPDGRTLATGSSDKKITLWDVASGKQLATSQGTMAVQSVAFSPDGKTLASGSLDKTVKLWDRYTLRQLASSQSHTMGVQSVAFSPDGKTLASGSLDKTVKLWDANTLKLLASQTSHTMAVQSVAFSPDGKILASGSADKTIKLFDGHTLQLLATFQGHTMAVQSVAFSADSKTLASGSADRTIKLWDASTRKELATLTGHTDVVSSLAFSADGKTLASGSGDNTIRLWDVATDK